MRGERAEHSRVKAEQAITTKTFTLLRVGQRDINERVLRGRQLVAKADELLSPKIKAKEHGNTGRDHCGRAKTSAFKLTSECASDIVFRCQQLYATTYAGLVRISWELHFRPPCVVSLVSLLPLFRRPAFRDLFHYRRPRSDYHSCLSSQYKIRVRF